MTYPSGSYLRFKEAADEPDAEAYELLGGQESSPAFDDF